MINVGDCFYCEKPVMAGEGQSIKWLIRKTLTFGEVTSTKQFPTHKKCRKQAK